MSLDPPETIDPELLAAGYVPPDPDEPRPFELWSAVGDVRPWGTLIVLLAWGVMFLLEGRGGAFDNAGAMAAWGANATGLDAWASAWRLLASTFLHAGVAHVFFNATSLLVVAPAVERLFTRWGFWVVYAAGGAVASLASLAWRTYQHTLDRDFLGEIQAGLNAFIQCWFTGEHDRDLDGERRVGPAARGRLRRVVDGRLQQRALAGVPRPVVVIR